MTSERIEPIPERDSRLDGDYQHQDSEGAYLTEIGRTPLLNAEQEVELAKRIEMGQLAQYILDNPESDDAKEIVAAHRLSVEELEWLAEDGREAKNHMLRANLRLVVSIAKRYGRRTTPSMGLLDIIQEGNTGLVRAVEKFDYAKGFKFSTYATWWIRQSLTRGIGDQSRTVRLPIHIVEAISKVRTFEQNMLRDLGRAPTDEEIAKELNFKLEKVAELKQYTKDMVSLNNFLGDESGNELQDVLRYESPTIMDHVGRKETRQALENVLDAALDDVRDAEVLRMRMGLYDGKVWKLEDIAQRYHRSKERIRQIESQAFRKVRAYLRDNGLEESFFRD